jgi:hypothetical protein
MSNGKFIPTNHLIICDINIEYNQQPYSILQRINHRSVMIAIGNILIVHIIDCCFFNIILPARALSEAIFYSPSTAAQPVWPG